MYEAKQRLRTYNVAVQEKINEYFSEHGNWSVKINSQDWADLRFEAVDGNKQIWTADIELTKNDGSYGNITGTYTGRFAFKMDSDLSGYDANFGEYIAHDLNVGGQGVIATTTEDIVGWFGSPGDCQLVEWSGKTSEMSCIFEIPDCELNLALAEGTSRAFFEIPVYSDYLYMTEYNRNIDRTLSLSCAHDGWSEETVLNISMVDDDVKYYNTYTANRPWPVGSSQESGYVTPDYLINDIIDYAPDMVLIIDMLGN